MKKILIALSVAVSAVAANASYLWWSVSDANANIADATKWADGYNQATVYAYTGTDASTANAVQNTDGSTTVTLLNGESGQIWADVSSMDGKGYSFFIELASSSGSSVTRVATSSAVAYADLVTAGSIVSSTEMSAVPNVTVWHGSSYKAAPEPTSAMLMLLGIAGLALKRKQKKPNEV